MVQSRVVALEYVANSFGEIEVVAGVWAATDADCANDDTTAEEEHASGEHVDGVRESCGHGRDEGAVGGQSTCVGLQVDGGSGFGFRAVCGRDGSPCIADQSEDVPAAVDDAGGVVVSGVCRGRLGGLERGQDHVVGERALQVGRFVSGTGGSCRGWSLSIRMPVRGKMAVAAPRMQPPVTLGGSADRLRWRLRLG